MPGTILFGVDVESASDASAGFAQYAEELFRELNTPVTWYLTGKTLELYPDVFRRLKGHPLIELQAHTYSHTLLKTVLTQLSEGRPIGPATKWEMTRGGSVEEIDRDLGKCQDVFEKVLGRRAAGLTGPWAYYRGLGDRPDLLEIADRHGFKILRTFGRDERDSQPVPLEWQPFFYEVQGFPHILEILIHDYQDDYMWRSFARPEAGESYLDHLKQVADGVAQRDLTWSLCSHDHGCQSRETFEKRGSWFRGIIQYAKGLDIRFLTASQFYQAFYAPGA
jgi:peptidoglycan/xylan/chitin deacetylase (PgdA/CDA1 family)